MMHSSVFLFADVNQAERMSARRGFTLIEMVVTITVGSIVMLSAVTIVHRAMTVRVSTMDHFEQTRKLERFIFHWRQEVHRARSVVLNDLRTCTLLTETSLVKYEIDGGRVSRTESPGNESDLADGRQVVPNATQSSQLLKLSPAVSMEFSATRDNELTFEATEELPHSQNPKTLAVVVAYCNQFSSRNVGSTDEEAANEN